MNNSQTQQTNTNNDTQQTMQTTKKTITREEYKQQIAMLKAMIKKEEEITFRSEFCKNSNCYHFSFNSEFKNIALELIKSDATLKSAIISQDEKEIVVNKHFKTYFFNLVRVAMIKEYNLKC